MRLSGDNTKAITTSKGGRTMEKWIVFYNRETGEEYASYTYRGTFKGEEEATRELIAFEEGITPEVIETRIEIR